MSVLVLRASIGQGRQRQRRRHIYWNTSTAPSCRLTINPDDNSVEDKGEEREKVAQVGVSTAVKLTVTAAATIKPWIHFASG